MKNKKQYLTIISLVAVVAIFQGCVQKQADGTYPTVYSYDPYPNTTYAKHTPYQQAKKTINTALGTRHHYATHVEYQGNTNLGRRHSNVTHRTNQYRRYSYQRLTNQRVHGNQTNLIANQIERIARSHLGKTYVWGANGPYAFDCSGFTKSVFDNNGISIPRVSKDQAKVGQYVPKSQLQKGDLVFFDSNKSSKVSHVGIYLGNGQFIHASSSKKRVVIGNLNSGYHSKHFKWGRRLTSANNIYASR